VTDPKEPDLRKIKPKETVACVFCVLQVVVFLTDGMEGKRRRKQGRSAHFRALSVTVARCSTRRHCSSTVAAIPEAFPLQFLEF
jgi:hypothetical protein